MSAQQHRSEGYTLLEMLVVLGLLGLILSVSLPMSFRSVQSRDLNEQARMVTTVLKIARTEAIVRNKQTIVEADVTKNHISFKDGGDHIELDRKIALKMLTARQETIRGRGAIRFFPNGSSTGGMVILQNAGHSVTIRVDWLTGKTTRVQ